MGVHESCAKIKRSLEDMNIVWSQTKEVWKDEKARQFENEFVERLASETKRAETSLDNISPLLNRIQSELKE